MFKQPFNLFIYFFLTIFLRFQKLFDDFEDFLANVRRFDALYIDFWILKIYIITFGSQFRICICFVIVSIANLG